MKPDRAAQVVPAEAVITAETKANYYGSAWVVWARMPDGYERPLTMFPSSDPWGAAHWIVAFEKCRQTA